MVFVLGAVLGGCGGPAPAPPPRAPSLDELVPWGFESLVRVRPRALLADDATMRVVEAIVPSTRLDAFRDRHGIELRALELFTMASYPDDAGTALFASGPFHSAVVVGEIGHRMAPLESSADRPVMRRAGIYRMRRFELLAIGAHEVALVDGPPELAGLLVDQRRRALAAAPAPSDRLARLIAEEADAVFLVARHGRPALGSEGIGLVLARLQDALLAVSAAGALDPGAIELRLQLLGEFPPGVDENLRALLTSLAESDLGRAVGVEELLHTLSIEVTEGRVRLTGRVRGATLVRGLRVLFGAEIEEMLDAG